MSQDKGNFRGRRGNKNKVNFGGASKEILDNLNENNPIIQQFRQYATELDAKHDKYEKIVKISRDITIESKRIIFLLHTIDRESKRDAVLAEAETRLNSLVEVMFKKVAVELEGEDPYLYLRAYRGGFQEFIEALTFFWYMKDKSLHDWTKVEESMTYIVKDEKSINDDKPDTHKNEISSSVQEQENKPNIQESDNNSGDQGNSDDTVVQETNKNVDTPETCDDTINERTVKVLVKPVEYILGIADLTGELMRKCINNLGSGDIDSCFETCDFVRQMYTGFLGCTGGREVSRKIFTLKQSLAKMENVCYTIKVRGSEIPHNMLAHVAMSCSGDAPVDDDEGYQA